ncbi:dolichyl-phosphate-mannose--protein mannosyltransferase [Oscillospiraceae bacterium HV4-5-C5C]|nr:dolichyl-phosphate-mannose--protein mannosyltransferase [Oscillospiraceae bacterium HV4-5-C5C]
MIFISEAAWGIYLGYGQNLLLGDAVSRTANAFYVLFIKPYRLTSMGLVWNPLPSLLQLPFVALAKLWRPFVTRGVGAAIITALMAGWMGQTLLSTFQKLKVPSLISLTLTLLSCFNPYVFFYGANGMSEIFYYAFAVSIICCLSQWLDNGSAKHLIKMGFSFVGLFLSRYEAIPFALAVAFVMCIHMSTSTSEKQLWADQPEKELFFYMESTLWVTFLPMIYTVLVWIVYNLAITGNPIYFMNSGYSMNATSSYYMDYGGFWGALSYEWIRVWPFLFMFAALLIVRVTDRSLATLDSLKISITTLALTAFQLLMISRQKSEGYVRYLSYPLVIAMAWIPYLLKRLRRLTLRTAAVILALALVINGLYFGWALQHDSIMKEDTTLSVPPRSLELAYYINSELKHETILMDSFRTYYTIMNLDRFDDLITSCSVNYEEALEDPIGNQVDYLVVPQPGGYGNMDALNIQFPGLYEGQLDWCEEVASFGEFKVFNVQH